jgi:uncharacterized protein
MTIRDQDDLFIPMPDGVRLAARLWRPEGEVVPAILEFIPYRKRDATLPRDETIHPWMAAQGYACLRVDLRGAGDSEGLLDDEYSAQELSDACAVIGWAASQPWCTGAVGMMGKSWGGFNSLQTAALNPPGLRAVVAVCATTDRFADDIHFKGGCLMGENFGWGSLMLSYQSRPPDPMLRPDWRAALRARLAALPHLSEVWAREQARGPYWRHGSVGADWSALKLPILIFGGWADGYMNAPAALAANVPTARAVVGPWVHQYAHTATPGPRIDFLGELRRWWDHWLKGIDTGADRLPTYRVYMQDSHAPDPGLPEIPGRWLAEAMPSPRVTARRLALGSDGRLGGAGAPDRRIASPQTLGARAGEYFPMGLAGEIAGDQRDDDARAVCFEMDCPEGLALMGAARLELTLSADRPHAFVHARLCDVAPDGASTRIAHGFLNLRHRTDPPTPLVPGEVVRVAFDLDQMAHRLAPGHRLRLALANACWPFVWPSPAPVALHLAGGALTLPVHDGTAPGWPFDPPPPVAPSRLMQVPPSEGRRLDFDLIDGTQQLIFTSDGGVQRNPDHGLATQSRMHETWTIAPEDPTSARVLIRWEQSHSRPDGWAVTSIVSTGMWCDGAEFELEAEVRVEIEEPGHPTEVLRRDFVARVPRIHV